MSQSSRGQPGPANDELSDEEMDWSYSQSSTGQPNPNTSDNEEDMNVYDSDEDQELVPLSQQLQEVLSGQGLRTVPILAWEQVSENTERRAERYQLLIKSAIFKINHSYRDKTDLKEFCELIDEGFEGAVLQLANNCEPNDRISITIDCKGFVEPLYIPPQRIATFDKTSFLRALYKVAQSNTQFLIDGLFDVNVNIYKSMTGYGRSKKSATTYRDPKAIKCIITTYKDGKCCGYCAIAIGVKSIELKINEISRTKDCSEWKYLTGHSIAQIKAGRELCNRFGIDFNTPMNNEILNQIQNLYENQYQIIVIDHKSCKQIFKGPDCEHEIYLLYDSAEQHYSFIKKITNYLHRTFYCKYCDKGFNELSKHNCNNTCSSCRSLTKCQPEGQSYDCNACNKTFQNKQCFDNHKKNKCCVVLNRCTICEMDYINDKKHKHVCNEFKCHQCNEYYTEQPHYCYLKTLNADKLHEEDNIVKIIVSFDIESMLICNNNILTHKPNLVCAKVVCTKCWDDNTDTSRPNCPTCAGGNKVFAGSLCIDRFNDLIINDLSKRAQQIKGYVVVIAHNLSGYDGHWILTDLMARNMQNISPIMKGTKIMKIDMDNVRYIDSLLFFQRPLADLSKMFDIKEAEKGFFPHHYNTPENQSNIVPYSSLTFDDFGHKSMNSKRAKEFENWFANQCRTNQTFNLQKELRYYCGNDVNILIQAMMRFRKLFKQTTGLDPFSRSFTLASVGLEFFRTSVMKDNEIGITPINGYTPTRLQSNSGKAWLDMKDKEYEGSIIVREGRVGTKYADGYIKDMALVFEFLGCYYHGHGCKPNTINEEAKNEWTDKLQYYDKMGISVDSIYECQWKQQLQRIPQMKAQFNERYNYHKNVQDNELFCIPRKALSGGRTNNLKFQHICASDETLLYLDFTSLYPYVLSRRAFPIGHPIRITSNFSDVNNYFGFISCKVLPPKQLYIPVLPMVINGKLLFPLCMRCATTQSQESCDCEDNDRCLTQTFTTVELHKAMQLGYKVVELYEVLHYPKISDEIFKNYINTWYKIKAEASGYPKNLMTEEQKNQFVNEFESVEQIELNTEKINSNPGLRSIAKLMLNSLWGKLAQRPNMPETKIVNNCTELYDIITNDDYEILGDQLFGDMVVINYKRKDETQCNPRNTSVAIAAFVTAYARLKLYEEIEKLEMSRPGSVMYYDTDSIIFVHKHGDYKPNVKNFLGEMTDEIVEEYGVGSRMTEFYSCGPKVYAYRVVKPDGSVEDKFKAKGLTQTVDANGCLNFETIKNTVNNPTLVTKVPQMHFRANKRHEVFTKFLDKDFRLTSNKRRIIGNDTLPYGYMDNL